MDIELANIFLTSGVNEEGEGFVHIAAHSSEGGIILIGQLTPQAMREHGMACVEAAEAAEQDAAVLRTIRKLQLPDQLAGAIISELRDTRSE
jgi:hypothetical protein